MEIAICRCRHALTSLYFNRFNRKLLSILEKFSRGHQINVDGNTFPFLSDVIKREKQSGNIEEKVSEHKLQECDEEGRTFSVQLVTK
jgi:hypothetical protein